MWTRMWVLAAAALAGIALLTPPAAAKQTRIVYGFSGVKQLTYAANLIALERMRDRAYDAVPVFFPRPELAVQALLRGEVDMARGEPGTVSTAIMRGARLAIIAAPGLSQWVLVASKTFSRPRDLSRKRIAVHSLASMSNTVVQFAIKKHGILAPQILVIPGSPARAQALLQGEIDATSLFLADAIRLDLMAPGRFHIVADFKDLPVLDSILAVRRDWLETRQEEVQDLLRVLVETHRRIAAGPEWAVARTLQFFPDEDPKFVAAVVRAHTSRGVWDVNGGIAGATAVREMIQFLKSIEALPAAASAEPADYADLRPLEAVLQRIGRK